MPVHKDGRLSLRSNKAPQETARLSRLTRAGWREAVAQPSFFAKSVARGW